MVLSGGIIAAIVIVALLGVVLVIACICYTRRKTGDEDEVCGKLLQKYRARERTRSGMVARYPEVNTSYVRTHVAGQQFTSRELMGEGFIIPSRNDVEDETRPSMYGPIDPASIDPRLYTAGYEKEEGSTSPMRGKRPPQVIFSLEYDQDISILKICVLEARHLRPNQYSGTCDPYCTVAVIPGHGEKQSKVMKQTIDPIFNENFSFEVAKDEMKNKSIEIKFYDFDQYSRDECSGILIQSLAEIDVFSEKKIDLWRKIAPTRPEKPKQDFGGILIRLGYLPSAEKLTVVLLKARNLKYVGADEEPKQPDPYVRVAILHDGNLLKKKKTSTKRKSTNPTYNQAINFNVPLDVIPQVEIQFHIVHDSGVKINRALRKETIGYLEIGSHSKGEEYEHWMDLMSNKPQARWHSLQEAPESESTVIAETDPSTPSASQSQLTD